MDQTKQVLLWHGWRGMQKGKLNAQCVLGLFSYHGLRYALIDLNQTRCLGIIPLTHLYSDKEEHTHPCSALLNCNLMNQGDHACHCSTLHWFRDRPKSSSKTNWSWFFSHSIVTHEEHLGLSHKEQSSLHRGGGWKQTGRWTQEHNCWLHWANYASLCLINDQREEPERPDTLMI